jgi:hypothetical protein
MAQPNAGQGAAKEEKLTNLHTVMPNAPGATSVGSMIFYVVIRET